MPFPRRYLATIFVFIPKDIAINPSFKNTLSFSFFLYLLSKHTNILIYFCVCYQKRMHSDDENDKITQNYSNPKKYPPYFTDRYGFVINEATTIQNVNAGQISYKWHCLFAKEDIRKSKKAQKLIFRGIPIFLKYKAWSLFTLSNTFDYDALCNKVCGYEHQIHVDVQRTFRQHSLFKDKYGIGQARLFRVLVAFANYNTNIGYCQGMSSIVGLLLMYFPEKESLSILICTIQKNNLNGLFDKSLSMMPLLTHLQGGLFKELVNEIYVHISKHNVDLSVFIFSWYLTLFTRFDIQFTLRVWDLLLFYDFTILLLVSCAILRYYKDKILKLKGENLIHFISSLENYYLDADIVLEQIRKYHKEVNLERYRKEIRSYYNQYDH